MMAERKNSLRVSLGSGFVRESLVEGKRILIERKQSLYLFSFFDCWLYERKRTSIERKQSSFLFSFLGFGCGECDDTLCLGGMYRQNKKITITTFNLWS